MKRILLVVPRFPLLSETFIVSKFLGLLDRGWDVHVVCGQSNSSQWDNFPTLQRRDLRARVHVTWPTASRWQVGVRFPFAFAQSAAQAPGLTRQYLVRGWKTMRRKVAQRFYLDAKLVELQPDLIHFEFGALAVDRMYLKALLECRVTVSFRGYDISYVGLDVPGFYDEVWDEVDALHLLGNDLWKRAQQRGCPPDKPHRLIPPAIDTTFFDPASCRQERVLGVTGRRPLHILGVGRLAWTKGYEYALQAVRQLVDRGVDCRYTIVGDGPYLGAVAFARHQLGLEHVVKLTGALTREDVRAQMAQADIFLHTAVSEGFCNAVLEAQAMELPVVCSDAAGLPENVMDGETGFVVPRREVRALVERITYLSNNPEVCTTMGRAGRRRVTTRFQLSDQISAFEALYQNVLR